MTVHTIGTETNPYTLNIRVSILFPALDSTTYYFGYENNPTYAISSIYRVYIPQAGTIKKCYVNFTNGTIGTNETSTISIRVNNTTDYTISSTVTNDANPTAFSSTAMSVPVVAGDYIQLKWTTPIWVTNPLTVTIGGIAYIQ